jgi:deoxycytidine triphosphate deaminase
MAVLSDFDIEEAIKRKDLGIEPFTPKNLTPNGYDLSIDEIFIKKTNERIQS